MKWKDGRKSNNVEIQKGALDRSGMDRLIEETRKDLEGKYPKVNRSNKQNKITPDKRPARNKSRG